MKKVLMLITVLLGLSPFGWAGACGVSTVNVYDTPGFSCTIGDKTFSGFTYSATSVLTNKISDTAVAVVPITTPGDPGFLFTAPWNVSQQQGQNSFIGFNVAVHPGGRSIGDASLGQLGSGFSGTGIASVGETLCLGDTFADGCLHGVVASLNAENDASKVKLSDSINFAPVTLIGVTQDLSVVGGPSGSARLGGLQEQFFSKQGIRSEPTTTPEPASLILFASGLLALGGVVRRRQASK
jgi:hypothetical protein